MTKLYVFGTRGFPNIQGGVERHCEKLYGELSRSYQITLFRRKAYVSDKNVLTTPIHYIDLPSGKIKGIETLFHSLLATLYCIVNRPDIVHIHNIGPALFAPLLKLFRLNVVVTYHSSNYEHSKWPVPAKLLLRLGEWCALTFADSIIFVSHPHYRRFQSRYGSKLHLVPNGFHRALPTADSSFLSQISVKPREYILAVGRITPEKGFDLLVTSFLKTDNLGYKLIIAGGADHSSSYAANLKRRVEKEGDGRIIMTGVLSPDKLNQLYSHALLLVVPSRNEGYSIVITEALTLGIPLLVSNIPSNRQFDLPAECYFESENDKQLSAILSDKMTHPTFPPPSSVRLYQWTEVADATSLIYQSLL